MFLSSILRDCWCEIRLVVGIGCFLRMFGDSMLAFGCLLPRLLCIFMFVQIGAYCVLAVRCLVVLTVLIMIL